MPIELDDLIPHYNPYNERKWKDESLMVHDWPESGPNGVTIEVLYQAFKDRLVSDLKYTGLIGDDEQDEQQSS